MDVIKIITEGNYLPTAFFSLGFWYLQKIVTAFERMGEKQNEFNAALVRIETRLVTEIEHLKETVVEHSGRLSELEKR